jgi:hypothetical protein
MEEKVSLPIKTKIAANWIKTLIVPTIIVSIVLFGFCLL